MGIVRTDVWTGIKRKKEPYKPPYKTPEPQIESFPEWKEIPNRQIDLIGADNKIEKQKKGSVCDKWEAIVDVEKGWEIERDHTVETVDIQEFVDFIEDSIFQKGEDHTSILYC